MYPKDHDKSEDGPDLKKQNHHNCTPPKDMSFTFEVLNMIQMPRNYSGQINQLPIHIKPGSADLYKEERHGSVIHFKPVKEFISLKGPKDD